MQFQNILVLVSHLLLNKRKLKFLEKAPWEPRRPVGAKHDWRKIEPSTRPHNMMDAKGLRFVTYSAVLNNADIPPLQLFLAWTFLPTLVSGQPPWLY